MAKNVEANGSFTLGGVGRTAVDLDLNFDGAHMYFSGQTVGDLMAVKTSGTGTYSGPVPQPGAQWTFQVGGFSPEMGAFEISFNDLGITGPEANFIGTCEGLASGMMNTGEGTWRAKK